MPSLPYQFLSPRSRNFPCENELFRPIFRQEHAPSKTNCVPIHVSRLENIVATASTSKLALEKWAEAEDKLQTVLRRELMPKHVAVIMDGNRRWAHRRGLSTETGYRSGAKTLVDLAALCLKYGIQVLSAFAFSFENWKRPSEEVNFLMSLFEEELIPDLITQGRDHTKVSVVGDLSMLPESLQKLIIEAEDITRGNTRLHLMFALNYSGQYDIVQACKSIARKVKDNHIGLEDIDQHLFEQELKTNLTKFPHPDLLIRTSGEQRISNFMLWQQAYTELYFTDATWPEFGERQFLEALCSFQLRTRRFGGH